MENQIQLLPLTWITSLVFVFMVIRLLIIRSKSTKNQPPSPWIKLPLIGHLHLLISSLPHRRLAELSKKYGSVMHLQLGELSHVIVSSPEAAKQVLKTHDAILANRPYLLVGKIVFYNFSDIAFAPYGDYWRQLRKVSMVELLSTKRVQSFRSIREEQTSSLVRSILSNTGLEINLGEILCNFSYNVTLMTAFGGRCKQHEKFVSLMRETLEATSGLCVADLYPSTKLLTLISGLRITLERLHLDLDRILESIIQDNRSSNANSKDREDVTDCFLDVLLRLQDDASQEFPLNTDNIKAIILDILVGGTESSSTTAEWAMSEMVKNPRILKKAQEEVRRVYDRVGTVNESHLDELKYLKLVIKETLRLHPPAPLLVPRDSMETCEINGYEIPAKTKVVVNAWAIGRDPNHWHEAERFNPERFVDSSVDFKGNSMELLPFGAGRRICPGVSFAVAVVELTVAQLLYHFDWKLPNGMKNEDLDMAEMFVGSVRKKRQLHLIPIPYQPPCVQ